MSQLFIVDFGHINDIFLYENDIILLFIILSHRNNCAHLSTSRKSVKIIVILAEQGKKVGMTLLQFGATS